MIHKHNPPKNPVMNRSVLLLILFVSNCVVPSIAIDITSNIDVIIK